MHVLQEYYGINVLGAGPETRVLSLFQGVRVHLERSDVMVARIIMLKAD